MIENPQETALLAGHEIKSLGANGLELGQDFNNVDSRDINLMGVLLEQVQGSVINWVSDTGIVALITS